MSTAKLYPSVPLESATVFEEPLEKKLNDINSFNTSDINLKEMITYC